MTDEIRLGEISIPLINYVNLIKNRKSPYIEVVQLILKEMEHHYLNAQKDGQSETTYTINPRILTDEIELLVQSQAKEKLTNINVCRTILALCYGSKLKEEKDFFISTTSSGRRNYHIKVNQSQSKDTQCLFENVNLGDGLKNKIRALLSPFFLTKF